MPSNTTFAPVTNLDFDSSKLQHDGRCVSATITAGQTQNIDFTLTDDCLVTGVWIIINNGNYGDTGSLQIVDTAGILAPAGTVLNQFVTNWMLPPTCSEQFMVPYPAKVPAGLTIRLIYNSSGTNDVFVAMNYGLHKVLV